MTFEEKWNNLARIAENDQFCLEILEQMTKKWSFGNFSLENQNFLRNCMKKSKFLGNFSGKIKFFTRIQISNQIDATALHWTMRRARAIIRLLKKTTNINTLAHLGHISSLTPQYYYLITLLPLPSLMILFAILVLLLIFIFFLQPLPLLPYSHTWSPHPTQAWL